jgi:prepilin-type N-terminal cleavage/methylation domain-containing protein
MKSSPNPSSSSPRHLRVRWSGDRKWKVDRLCPGQVVAHGLQLPSVEKSTTRAGSSALSCCGASSNHTRRVPWLLLAQNSKDAVYVRRGFTLLEMLVVVSIIGFLAAISLPAISGMTRANSMNTALQQLQTDCGLARQLALTRRTTVYMVFVPQYSVAYGQPINELSTFNNLLSHQYSAYALVSLRSVGDQPGRAYPQYLTEWKPLPEGIFVASFKFSSPGVTQVLTTNTLTGATNVFNILPFPYMSNNLPYPAADSITSVGPYEPPLPYVAFSPLGQLVTTNNFDEYIPLARGKVQYVPGNSPGPALALETPVGNSTNNCNIIHLDWLTARATIERNALK